MTVSEKSRNELARRVTAQQVIQKLMNDRRREFVVRCKKELAGAEASKQSEYRVKRRDLVIRRNWSRFTEKLVEESKKFRRQIPELMIYLPQILLQER